MQQIYSSYRWAISAGGLLLALGFILHPPLDVHGMGEAIWVPDHVLILVSLVLLIPGYAMLGLGAARPTILGVVGLTLGYLALCSFLGVVYFELMIIPTLVLQAPHVLDHGLLVGPLAWFLPLTGLSFVVAHFILGTAWWRAGFSRPGIGMLMLGSIGIGLKPILPTAAYISGAVVFAIALHLIGRHLQAGWNESASEIGRTLSGQRA